MRQIASYILFFAVLVLVLPSCKPIERVKSEHLSNPVAIEQTGDFTHQESRLVFPVSVDKFNRDRLVRYDTLGWDVSAGYDAMEPGVPLTITVYVYPAPRITSVGSPQNVINDARSTVFKNWFAQEKSQILSAHPGIALVSETEISSREGEALIPGGAAVFDSPTDFKGMPVPTRTHIYVTGYVLDHWAVKYRFTHPKDFDAAPLIDEFIGALGWTRSK